MTRRRCSGPVSTGRCRMAGFTLVEMAVVLVLACLLAAMAIPSWTDHLARARRSDAVASLLRLQAAQERYRSDHGVYATTLAALPGAGGALSAEGFYEISLLEVSPEAYLAAARARADGPQAGDADCREIQLQIRLGLASHAPSARCWNL